jgi:hypothetical protein
MLSKTGFGSLSTAIYDTAWVAMIRKDIGGKVKILFPECFDYVEWAQLPDGSWPSEDSSVDCILNSLAGLLALKTGYQHRNDASTSTSKRCERAIAALQRMLKTLDIKACNRGGV